jgi:hypothetical protein
LILIRKYKWLAVKYYPIGKKALAGVTKMAKKEEILGWGEIF